MKIKEKQARKNVSVSVPAELIPEIKRRAIEDDRSVSTYVCRLIRLDVITLKKS
jgi:hypothetical protein